MTAPAYGYAHRARVVRLGEAEETYLVEVPDLAPGILSGPFTSAVRDLLPGDQVLVLQLGITGGDMVIVGRLPERAPPFTLPIEISDVTGLAAALDDRATDAELDALQDATNLSFLTVNDMLDEYDGRLDVLETSRTALEAADVALAAADAALDVRLDIVEPLVTSHTGLIAANGAAITALNNYSSGAEQREVDMFGDVISSFPRHFIANTRTLSNTGGYFVRHRIRKAANISFMRVFVTVAGAGGGTTTAVLYRSTTPTGAYTQIATGTHALATTGEAAITLGATTLNAGDYLIMAIRPLGYTASTLSLGMVQNNVRIDATKNAMNPAAGRYAWVTKSVVAAMPSSIDIQDGTFTLDISPWWVALA